jgi:hypothetical protein
MTNIPNGRIDCTVSLTFVVRGYRFCNFPARKVGRDYIETRCLRPSKFRVPESQVTSNEKVLPNSPNANLRRHSYGDVCARAIARCVGNYD